ncbi:MAG: cysteine hydrolase [Deltaproteobacteria bacterium]|nr:cysteine hydrolase [Deltaproteobacteria bacterium]
MQVKYPIIPEKTAMIVVDMQNDFVQEGAPIEIPRARAMVPRLNRLLDVCRAHQIPVIYIHHVIRGGDIDAGRLADHHEAIRNNKAILAGTPNVEIYEGLKPHPGDLVVAKPRYSAFYGTDLEAILRSQGIDTLIISGTVTDVCCESTTQDAFSRDYKVIFLSDGTAATDWPDLGFGPVSAEEVQKVVLTVLAMCFAQVSSIDQVMAEIEHLSSDTKAGEALPQHAARLG